jgi:hypothetical protein
MTEQNIVIYPRERRILFFEGTTYEMDVESVPWNEMEIKFVNSRLYQSNKASNNKNFFKVHEDKISNRYKEETLNKYISRSNQCERRIIILIILIINSILIIILKGMKQRTVKVDILSNQNEKYNSLISFIIYNIKLQIVTKRMKLLEIHQLFLVIKVSYDLRIILEIYKRKHGIYSLIITIICEKDRLLLIKDFDSMNFRNFEKDKDTKFKAVYDEFNKKTRRVSLRSLDFKYQNKFIYFFLVGMMVFFKKKHGYST